MAIDAGVPRIRFPLHDLPICLGRTASQSSCVCSAARNIEVMGKRPAASCQRAWRQAYPQKHWRLGRRNAYLRAPCTIPIPIIISLFAFVSFCSTR